MSKLLKVLISKLDEIKKDNSKITLDLSNKENVFEDLLIPLMNLTKTDSLTELYNKLNIVINKADTKNSEFTEIAEKLVSYVMEDTNSESNDIYDEFSSLMSNCMAIYNTLKKSIDENAIDSMNFDIAEYINTKINKDDAEIENEDVKESPEDKEENDTEKVEETPVDAKLNIISSDKEVDDTPWGEVNKIEIKNKLKDNLDAAKSDDEKTGAKAAIDEMFGLVTSYDKMGDWKFPHHVIVGEDVILNVNGLKTAALFLLRPNTSKNLSSSEKTAIAKHLTRHYDELKLDKPEKLKKISENKESEIIINVKDDELKEFADVFKTNIENLNTYVGLFESLLTDLVNSGIIDIQNNKESVDDTVIQLKLSKEQVEEFINYFDVMSDDILNILSGKLTAISYKKTNEDLEKQNVSSDNVISDLKDKVAELTEKVEKQKSDFKEVLKDKYDRTLIDNKFEAIINFINSTDMENETLIQVINNVIEAESKRDIDYLTSIGKAFVKTKITDETQFIKKTKISNRFDEEKIDELLDIVGNNITSNDESVTTNRISKLADYL